MIDLDKLEELAGKAKSGQWFAVCDDPESEAFVSACSPDIILALCREVRAGRRLRDWIAPIRDAHGSADKCECLNVIDSCAAIARDAVREYDTAREGK